MGGTDGCKCKDFGTADGERRLYQVGGGVIEMATQAFRRREDSSLPSGSSDQVAAHLRWPLARSLTTRYEQCREAEGANTTFSSA